ncbi:Arm DNA-binding domain-containing protein [Winslowiella iniecta]|uniref:Arm DNA-binding domain-containing protein n=1 Tax=Winslowiella iniecta TaxID=1560201 RepID=UPI00069FE092
MPVRFFVRPPNAFNRSHYLNAKPGIKARKLSDAHGFYLLINPHGSKLWYLKYRYKGKEKKLSFGAYPFITLADARRLRDEARSVLTAGTVRVRSVKKRNVAVCR